MGINIFMSLLFIFSIVVYFLPIEKNIKNKNKEDLPLVTFDKPMMYTIDEKNITRLAKAQSAKRYKNRDILINSDITLRNVNERKDYQLENLKALKIIKKNDILILKDNVVYTRDNFAEFSTAELYYDLKTKIAYNDTFFEGNYNNSVVLGQKLYIDTKISKFNSENVHFEIDLKK